MNTWKTNVTGSTWTDVYAAGKAAVDDFFGNPPPFAIAIGWWITGQPIEVSDFGEGVPSMLQQHYNADVEVRW